MKWMKNTAGRQDAVFTMAVIAFVIVAIKFIVSGATIELESVSYSLGEIDSLSIAAFLSPLFGTYAVRRHTDSKYDNGEVSDDSSDSQEDRG